MIIHQEDRKPMKRPASRRRASTIWVTPAVVALIGFTTTLERAQAAPATQSVRESPQILDRRTARIGELAADTAFSDLDGKARRLSEFRGQPVVVCVTSASCPLARKYLPVLGQLQRDYAKAGVRFVLINPQQTDSTPAVRQAILDAKYEGLYCLDRACFAASALALTSTTEVLLLDGARTIVYRGAVDDQYGLGYALEKPRRRYLAEAIDSLLAAREPDICATTAPGCLLEATAGGLPAGEASITYHNRISRIVQRNCQDCHRAGENGPFELGTYEQVVDHLPMIRKVVKNGTMPPWFADGKTGHWQNDMSLADRDKADLLAWAAAGAPRGDVADAPLPRTFAAGWKIGKPDAVFTGAPQQVPARGPIPYRYVVVDTNLEQDRWIKAVEIRSDQPQITHHLLAFLVFPKNDPRAKDYPDPRGGVAGYFAGLVPGQTASVFPAGSAKFIPKGAKILLQIHYTPNGTAVTDRPRIGFVFTDRPEHEVLTVAAHNERFKIPAGAERHPVVGNYTFKSNARVLSFNPHSHLRGSAWKYELILPDGTTRTLLDIPHYDFNWQLEYRLAEPLDVPSGAVIRATAWYDNSEKNPANPDPKATVSFGEQTSQEMMIGYITGYRLP
jgi:thiol-disulfide isomerase/thioredoxin/mono/diheme cytochrome c family protein